MEWNSDAEEPNPPARVLRRPVDDVIPMQVAGGRFDYETDVRPLVNNILSRTIEQYGDTAYQYRTWPSENSREPEWTERFSTIQETGNQMHEEDVRASIYRSLASGDSWRNRGPHLLPDIRLYRYATAEARNAQENTSRRRRF